MKQACMAQTDTAGRCRNMAGDGGLCPLHQNQALLEGVIKLATDPGKVLVKANVNANWFEKLVLSRVEVKGHNGPQLNARHAAEAKALGRVPFAIRKDVPDSGTQVFGPDGAQNVSVVKLFDELTDAGYRMTDIHMFPKKGGHVHVLVLNFDKDNAERDDAERVIHPTVRSFLSATWGVAHVFSNPPKDGKVIHTVNLTNRDGGEHDPEATLGFDNGLWAVKPYEA